MNDASAARPAGLPESVTAEEIRAQARRNLAERPPLGRALRKDAVSFAALRGEPYQFNSRRREWLNAIRMLWAADDYAGVALYRIRTALRAKHVPLIPGFIHRLSIVCFGMRIGDHVLIREGVYVPHGNIIVDGITTIDSGCVICPWVTIGLKQGRYLGPQIEGGVFIGTGAKILGNVHIGHDANIGAGAVVVDDVAPGASVGGVPARVLGTRP